MKYQVLSNLSILVFLMFASLQAIAQTNITIETKSASLTFVVQESGKLYFEDENLIVSEDGSASTTITLSDIKKIVFKSESSSSKNEQIEDENIIIYPNPTYDCINLANVNQEKVFIHLFSSDGRIITKKEINSADNIDVSALPSGVYFLLVNEKISKFIKR